jgi:hypothetical protein
MDRIRQRPNFGVAEVRHQETADPHS